MKIYTKTGDAGETSLFGGKRVSKAELRIESYGTVDELNSWIGLLSDAQVNKQRITVLRTIQYRLFTVGATLAADPEKTKLKKPDIIQDDIELLEKEIDNMNESLAPMRFFILPGGHKDVSFCHIARTVCRRAERLVVKLNESEKIDQHVIIYLNRLSDYLFVLGRKCGQELGINEIPWKPREEER